MLKQEAICSLHSGRKQLESTRNPKQEQILTPRYSQPRKRFTKACSDDDAISKRSRILVPRARAALQARHEQREPHGKP